MGSVFDSILDLQRQFDATLTPAMKRRQKLVQHDLLLELLEFAEEADLELEVSDGKGRRSRVPWARFFLSEFSDSPRKGWCVAVLFPEEGDSLVVSLMQGSSRFEKGTLLPRSVDELAPAAHWARSVLAESGLLSPRLVEHVEIGRAKLSRAFERGHVFGFQYARPITDIPTFDSDLRLTLRLLNRLYHELEFAGGPGAEPLEVVELREFVETVAGRRAGGVPMRRSAAERAVIERHAMLRVKGVLVEEGWSVEDTSYGNPYDYLCIKGDERLYVEVKGTTSDGSQVILTRNEVAHHRAHFPATALFVVCLIQLIGAGTDSPSAVGGKVQRYQPWAPSDESLQPISYVYAVGSD